MKRMDQDQFVATFMYDPDGNALRGGVFWCYGCMRPEQGTGGPMCPECGHQHQPGYALPSCEECVHDF